MDLTQTEAGTSQFYIPGSSSLQERRPRNLKQGDTFAMFDHYGDLAGGPPEDPEGLYHRDTRHLSMLRLHVQGHRPLLLSSNVQNNNSLLTVDLTNPDVYVDGHLVLPKDTIHLLRSKFLWDSACHEAIAVHNYASEARSITVSLDFAADFRDLFEVRGQRRARRGQMQKVVSARDCVVMRYAGLDDRVRTTALAFDPPPDVLDEHHAEWRIALAPAEGVTLFLTVNCTQPQPQPQSRPQRHSASFMRSLRLAQRARARADDAVADVQTSNAMFNELLDRSKSDLAMLTTETPYGRYPYAGIPWFSTAFGRDGIVTAIEMLAFDPGLARGVLEFLAATQAREVEPARDAEPGKILHETRHGEMANLGEVPFGQYYGSVDSTPLFVLLAGMYYRRTNDLETLRRLWPNLLAALQWIGQYGDFDGDGFVEYKRKTPTGLANQGWKDSEDSVFHADGELARGAIALCEVQAYVYAAKAHCAHIARALGDPDMAGRLEHEAAALRARFEERFWIDERDCYAIALDEDKRPCRVLSSNAGHALFCRISRTDRAARLARQLMSAELFSGWGIRTLGTSEARYNPMSYHNGSVWPHDNALIALGLARYGHTEAALTVLQALFDTSSHMDLRRLPELFCGFGRRRQRAPTFYPVACSPQAWASAAPFALLTAALGLQVDARNDHILFRHPRLPAFIDEIRLSNLRVGSSSVDVLLQRRGTGVAASLIEKRGSVGVEVVL